MCSLPFFGVSGSTPVVGGGVFILKDGGVDALSADGSSICMFSVWTVQLVPAEAAAAVSVSGCGIVRVAGLTEEVDAIMEECPVVAGVTVLVAGTLGFFRGDRGNFR